MSDLLINTQDAYTTWGVRMGEGFLDVLGASSPMKEFIENKSRLEHGKRAIINDPKIDEREITLSFTIVNSLTTSPSYNVLNVTTASYVPSSLISVTTVPVALFL